ncbi:unnamed protein product [Brassica oleracea var. botrytis]|uniref:BnaC05g26420D protein n=2 Tax=Brassica napus TaxID=3708 RepID=A0A078G2W1_BRANA|nr:hypothetical protein HID58_066709 [Brassica napus]CAF1929610.1 unnamed protein product [Brassica napus]CDY20850.1 BnaC05g26420D [Brassica napus]
MKTASRARKSDAGYDLTHLILGGITEATFRLQKIPQHAVNFPTVKDAADVVIATMMSGIHVRLLYLRF